MCMFYFVHTWSFCKSVNGNILCRFCNKAVWASKLMKIWHIGSCSKWKYGCWFLLKRLADILVYYLFCSWNIKYFRELGIRTWAITDNKLEELFQLSLRMFDTRLPPGVTVMSPFADDSSLNKIGVEVWSHLQDSNRKTNNLYVFLSQSYIRVHPFICIIYAHRRSIYVLLCSLTS